MGDINIHKLPGPAGADPNEGSKKVDSAKESGKVDPTNNPTSMDPVANDDFGDLQISVTKEIKPENSKQVVDLETMTSVKNYSLMSTAELIEEINYELSKKGNSLEQILKELKDSKDPNEFIKKLSEKFSNEFLFIALRQSAEQIFNKLNNRKEKEIQAQEQEAQSE